MQNKISKPEDLAKYVFRKLNGAKIPYPNPPLAVLNKLFEYLFYTSMKTEEGNLLRVTVTLIDPKYPDPSPPMMIVADRWRFVEFEKPIPFTIEALVKLSKAADPWSSSLAVYYDSKMNLDIWGLIDQSVHYQSFLNYEAETGSEQPGIFQASITGIGSIVVLFDYELLATLKQNKLVTKYIDVFNYGPISNVLNSFLENYKLLINDFIDDEGYKDRWDDWVNASFKDTLSRLLLRVQNHRHGGAILLTSDPTKDVDIKYKIEYNRIPNSIINLIKRIITNYYSTSLILDKMDNNKKTIPITLYLESAVSEDEKQETTDELKGAIRFIASQTCVDGLVLLNDQFVAKGFGVVLKTKELPSQIYISSTASASERSLTATDPSHFGTRHRSMFSYCWKHKGSLGFVVSQDGDIRAITRIENKLIVWENIKTQQFLRSNKIKRVPAPPKKQ